MVTATINACLALALMLLIEFAISGSFQVAAAYLWAVSLIGMVIFFGQFWRQRHLCRSYVSDRDDDQTNGNKIHS